MLAAQKKCMNKRGAVDTEVNFRMHSRNVNFRTARVCVCSCFVCSVRTATGHGVQEGAHVRACAHARLRRHSATLRACAHAHARLIAIDRKISISRYGCPRGHLGLTRAGLQRVRVCALCTQSPGTRGLATGYGIRSPRAWL